MICFVCYSFCRLVLWLLHRQQLDKRIMDYGVYVFEHVICAVHTCAICMLDAIRQLQEENQIELTTSFSLYQKNNNQEKKTRAIPNGIYIISISKLTLVVFWRLLFCV